MTTEHIAALVRDMSIELADLRQRLRALEASRPRVKGSVWGARLERLAKLGRPFTSRDVCADGIKLNSAYLWCNRMLKAGLIDKAGKARYRVVKS